MKITYYLASSLDGYIATAEGDVSWLDELGIPMEATNYETFYASVDGLVMGRNTYDFIHNYGEWPYGDKPSWICTHQKLPLLTGINYQSEVEPEAVVEEARRQGLQHLWLVGGGQLASTFIQKSLLRDVSITLMPVILGDGIKLFADSNATQSLRLKSAEPSAYGFVQLDYEV